MEKLTEYMQSYLCFAKAMETWFHSAHHVAKGPGFLSDHNDLYGSIYTQIGDHFDRLVEKSIALSGSEEIACPILLSQGAAKVLYEKYESPVNLHSEEIVKISIICISDLINALTSLYKRFEDSGYLTLGLEDAITSMANQYEKYLYFLGQRYRE